MSIRIGPVVATTIFPAGLLVVMIVLAFDSPTASLAVIALSIVLLSRVAMGTARLGALLLLMAFVTAPMNDLRPVASLSFITISDAAAASGIALHWVGQPRGRVRLPLPFILGAAGLVFIGTMATTLSADPGTSANYLSRMLVALVVLPVAFQFLGLNRRTISRLVAGYVIGQQISLLGALVAGADQEGRYLGLTTHPKFFGLCAALAAAACPTWSTRSVRRAAGGFG